MRNVQECWGLQKNINLGRLDRRKIFGNDRFLSNFEKKIIVEVLFLNFRKALFISINIFQFSNFFHFLLSFISVFPIREFPTLLLYSIFKKKLLVSLFSAGPMGLFKKYVTGLEGKGVEQKSDVTHPKNFICSISFCWIHSFIQFLRMHLTLMKRKW